MGFLITGIDEEGEKERISVRDLVLIVFLIVFIELVFGILGYYFINKLNLLDSIRNAALMIPSISEIISSNEVAGKIFSSIYGLITFFVLVLVISILAARISVEIA